MISNQETIEVKKRGRPIKETCLWKDEAYK